MVPIVRLNSYLAFLTVSYQDRSACSLCCYFLNVADCVKKTSKTFEIFNLFIRHISMARLIVQKQPMKLIEALHQYKQHLTSLNKKYFELVKE